LIVPVPATLSGQEVQLHLSILENILKDQGTVLLTDLSDADFEDKVLKYMAGYRQGTTPVPNSLAARAMASRAARPLTSGYYSVFKNGVQFGELEFAAESTQVSRGWEVSVLSQLSSGWT
jgi:hypothetical protein